jgi:hypothetical protein
MKRLIALIVLLAATAAGCTTEQGTGNANANNGTANANTNANANASKSPEAVSESDVIAREKALWDTIKRKDFDAFGNMLADDQVYVTSTGVFDKAGTIKDVKEIEFTDLSMQDFKVVNIDKDAVAVTYTVSAKGMYQGKPMPPGNMRASTAWVNRGGKWLAIYHQDTDVKQPPASQKATANANTNANANQSPKAATATASPATPAGSPATAAGSAIDPLGREKAVWDAIKRKDFAAFAAMLAPDAIEVEGSGVYDRSQSVEGLKQANLPANMTQTDYKEIKLDADASLITYTVKDPKDTAAPEGERHSSIWVKRDGQWLAAFHQGTVIVKPPPAPPAK